MVTAFRLRRPSTHTRGTRITREACGPSFPWNIGKLSGRAKRIYITLPERALTELDACTKSLGETRSGFLLRAELEFIARHRAA